MLLSYSVGAVSSPYDSSCIHWRTSQHIQTSASLRLLVWVTTRYSPMSAIKYGCKRPMVNGLLLSSLVLLDPAISSTRCWERLPIILYVSTQPSPCKVSQRSTDSPSNHRAKPPYQISTDNSTPPAPNRCLHADLAEAAPTPQTVFATSSSPSQAALEGI